MFSMRSFLQYLSMTGRRRWSRVLENVFSKPLQKSGRATRLYWRPRQPKWARSRKREQARLLPNREWSGQGRYKSVTTITRGPIHLQAKRLDAPALGVARRSISMNKLLKFRYSDTATARPRGLAAGEGFRHPA